MKNYDEIEEIEEFEILDVNKAKNKNSNIEYEKFFKWVEPFEKSLDKTVYILSHSLDLIQYYKPENVWYIDTRTFDLKDEILYTFTYRWKFTQGLPKKLLEAIPNQILKKAKENPVKVHSNICIELPTMSGKVEIIKEKFDRNKKVEYFVINPEIIVR